MAPNGVRIFIFLTLLFFFISGVHATNFTNPSDYYANGNDLVSQGKLEDALQAFRTAESMDQGSLEQNYGLSYQIGWILNRLGRYNESYDAFVKTEKNHPDWISNYAIYFNEGCLLAKLGRNQEAIQKFDQAIAIDYTNREVWFNKGLVLARMGQYDAAVDAFEKSRKAYGSYVPLLGSYREAANTYDLSRGIINIEPTPEPSVTKSTAAIILPKPTYNSAIDVDLQMRKGADFSSRYLYTDAIQAFDQVLANDPSNYRAMEAKGVALANLGRFDEALTMLNQAIPYIDTRVDESTYVDAWYVKGWVLANLGNYNEALDAFNKALTVDPDAFPAYYNKAYVLAKRGDTNAAVVAYNQSLAWDSPQRLEIKSYSILGPLGTYGDAADAIDNTIKEKLLYHADFSVDPQWQTNNPRNYYWDSTKQMYHFTGNDNPGYAEIPVSYKGTSFHFEFNITIPHADPGTVVHIGLSSHNATYYSTDSIFSEFRSWKAGTYKDLKDGDKTYQIIAVDNGNLKTNEASDYSCFINREEDRNNPTYGENRTYHVVIDYDKNKGTATTIVSDNLHDKTYFNCAGMYDKLGTYPNIDRIILVGQGAPNEYIEGYIDNVNLYATDLQGTTRSIETYTTQPPAGNLGSTSAVTTPTSTLSSQTNTTGLLPTGSTTGGGDNFVLYGVIGALVVLIAGGGFFVLKRKSAPSSVMQSTTLPDTPTRLQSVPTSAQVPVQPDDPASLPRELLSQYQDVRFIGQGGFARIFSAQKKDGTPVAIKVPLSMDAATGKTFVTELQNWTRLAHENIVRIYDFNVIPVPYFEMELCESSLAEMPHPMTPADASWLLFQICEGLKYAHSRNIVHRDLKPQNILMKNGIPKLSDWGLSRFLAESKISSTQLSFTPYYAAPEQISGKTKDQRTDIWQMGVIFYELVTGKLPFTGESMVEVMAGIATKTPVPPSQQCPAALDIEPVIMKCLEKDPKNRYQSVIDLQRALAAILKLHYTDSLKKSVSEKDLKRSAYYCGDLLMVNMKIGNLAGAHKYASDLAHYAQGDVKVQAAELAEQIQIRLEMNIPEIPDELIVKADMIVHRVSLGFDK